MSKVLKCVVIDCSQIDERRYREILSNISEERGSRAESFKSFSDKVMSAVAGLCMEGLASSLGTKVRRSENGKPVFERDDMYLSVSHSGGYVAMAWSDEPVGVDIQRIVPMGNIERRLLTDSECKVLEDRSDRSLTRVWTMKESYLKMTGDGIAKGLPGLDVLSDESPVIKEGYRFHTFDISDDVIVTICGRFDPCRVEVQSLDMGQFRNAFSPMFSMFSGISIDLSSEQP